MTQPPNDIPSLIRRVEEASGADREIDRELMALTYTWDHRYIGCRCWDDEQDTCCPDAKHLDGVWVDPATDKWVTTASDGYGFTTSVDAALSLIERVLPGYWWLVRSIDTGGAYANVGPIGTEPNCGGPCWPAKAPAPALALVAAMLRAIEARALLGGEEGLCTL